MQEPENHAAVKDCDGYVWVRIEDFPDPNPEWHPWWSVVDGPCSSVTWPELQSYGTLTLLSADRAARYVERVLKEVD